MAVAGGVGLLHLQNLIENNIEDEDSEEEDEDNQRRRRVKDRRDPFQLYTDVQFKSRFCFTKENVRRLVSMIEGRLTRPNQRGKPISPRDQVLLFLHHLGSSSYVRTTADLLGVTQGAARRAILRVVDAFNKDFRNDDEIGVTQ